MAEQKATDAKKRKLVKGRHRSAFKRQRQNVKRHARNLAVESRLKSAIKKVREAAAGKDKTQAQSALRLVTSYLHRAASKGLIHHRNASRNVARLSSLVHQLG